MAQLQLSLSRVVLRAIQGLDFARTHRWYCDQNACVFTLSMPRGPSDLDSRNDVASSRV